MSLIIRSPICICSLWFTYACGDRPYGRSPHAYVNQRLQIQLELLMMSDIRLEICWALNELWNNKFRYQVASCWLLLLSQNCTEVYNLVKIRRMRIVRWVPLLYITTLYIVTYNCANDWQQSESINVRRRSSSRVAHNSLIVFDHSY